MNTLPAISELEIENLEVYGARVHNLRDVDVSIPRNKLVVITGISGSGKSSLAFDTIYAEGQRRYMESFSAYARSFMGNMERPDVEKIDGLSPVISIEQKTTGRNPRSTVGTITEVYDFMRLLYARTSEAYSYITGKKMVRFSEAQILEHLLKQFDGKRIAILAPLVKGRKGHYRELFERIRKQGYAKVRVDGEILDLTPKMQTDRYKIHDIEVVIDRIKVGETSETRLVSSLDIALNLGDGLLMVMDYDEGSIHNFSKHLMCPESGIAYDEPSPNAFSFNSPYGACPQCKGLGYVFDTDLELIMPDSSLSINERGIVPYGEVRDNHIFKKLRLLSQHFGFTFATPLNQIPEAALDAMLHGTLMSVKSGNKSRELELEGIVNTVKRCYKDRQASEGLRRWAEGLMLKKTCNACNGQRLKKESLHFKIDGKNIAELGEMDINELFEWFADLEKRLNKRQRVIAKDVLKEIRDRIDFLLNVGLNYLNLNRSSRTLSGGEAQRIRLATQIGSQLVGITYILDEPSIGLHQRDNQRLIQALKVLSESGNSVLVVEHDKDIMLASDYVIDIGPGAGKHGGKIVGAGAPNVFLKLDTLTAQYLRDEKSIAIPKKRRKGNGKKLRLMGAIGNNLKNLTVDFPLGSFICVTGVSGSGKSSLINETLYPILNRHFYKAVKKTASL